MTSVLFIIAKKNFRDEELLEPKSIFEKAGFDITISSIEKGLCVGMLGAKVNADIAVKDADINDYDAVVVVGGMGSPGLADHKEVLEILKKANDQEKVIASICLAGVVLAKAGVLKGKKATVYKTPDSVKTLKDNGAIFTDEDITVDGLIVTANGPHAAKEFGRRIKELLT